MSVTQQEIADKVGLSRPMVALALGGHPKISARTRERVEEVARQLGYSPHHNLGARALAAKRYGKRIKTGIIAVLLPPEQSNAPVITEPYFRSLLNGIELEARTKDVDVLLSSARPEGLPRLIENRSVDGVVCLAPHTEVMQHLSDLGLPCITVSMQLPGTSGLAPDDERGAYLATTHLIELGHRKIAYLGLPSSNPIAETRLEGYRSALQNGGLPYNEELVEATGWSTLAGGGAFCVTNLISRTRDFTAIVCYNDTMAMGAIRHLEDNGIRVPQEVSVTGFDDVSTEYSFRPALTSVWFDRLYMGKQAVRSLYSAIVNEDQRAGAGTAEHKHLPFAHEVVPVKLIVRDSTRRMTGRK